LASIRTLKTERTKPNSFKSQDTPFISVNITSTVSFRATSEPPINTETVSPARAKEGKVFTLAQPCINNKRKRTAAVFLYHLRYITLTPWPFS